MENKGNMAICFVIAISKMLINIISLYFNLLDQWLITIGLK